MANQQNTNNTDNQQTQMVPVDTSQYTANVNNNTLETKNKGPFQTVVGGLGKVACGLLLGIGAIQLSVVEGVNKKVKNTGKKARNTALYGLEETLYKASGLEMPGKDRRKLDEARSLDL